MLRFRALGLGVWWSWSHPVVVARRLKISTYAVVGENYADRSDKQPLPEENEV